MTLTQINSKGIKDSEIVNADVASGAAIDKSKLNLGQFSNADIASNAAIDKSKLNLGQFSNADIASNAAIDISKVNIGSLSIDNSNVSGSANIDLSKINLSGLSITNSQVASNAAIDVSKINMGSLSIDNSNVTNSAAIAATKLAFTQAGGTQTFAYGSQSAGATISGTSRSVASRFQDIISVKDFGAVGNGSNNDTVAIQKALDAAVTGTEEASVYLPAGTYIVHDTIRIPSNTHFFGSGERSVIKMNKDIDNVKTLVQTGARNDRRKNIIIEDMTLDFNRERWQYRDPSITSGDATYLNIRTNNYLANGNTKPTDIINDGSTSSGTYNFDYGGDGYQQTYSHTLAIANSENVLIKNVRALDAYKHSIDISGCKYRRGFKGSNSEFDQDANIDRSIKGPQIYDTVKQTGTASKSDGSKIITVNIPDNESASGGGHGYAVGDEIYLNCSGTVFDKLYHVDTVTNDNTFTVIANRKDTAFNTTCYVIQDQGSKHVTLENCYASGAGDDNITTHYSSHLLITGCLSEFPSGRIVPQNSNCYEIDDGSRNVTITNCTARGGCKGLQIKGHAYAPAPYNVTVDGLRVVNCAEGMDIKHTGWGEKLSEKDSNGDFDNALSNWGGGQVMVNPDHQIRSGSITYMGGSPTAKNVTISNVQIIAPKGFVPVRDYVTSSGTKYGIIAADKQIQIYSYENVHLTNILISDGRFDLGADYDLALSTQGENEDGTNQSDSALTEVVDVFYGANSISFKNLSIHGFRSADFGVTVTGSFLQHFSIDGLVILDGPKTAVEFKEDYGNWVGIIDNYLILRPEAGSAQSGSIGIHNNQLGSSFIRGNGNIVRYATDVLETT